MKTTDLDFLKNKDSINGEKIKTHKTYRRRALNTEKDKKGRVISSTFFSIMVMLGKGDKNEREK